MSLESPEGSYILPIRASTVAHVSDLAAYLRTLRSLQVIVVDSSEPDVFAAHRAAFDPSIEHVKPDIDIAGRNGKVRGVLTGLRRVTCAKVIVADDDVRYDPWSLREVLRALDGYDIVRPQNYFDPLPWHAVLDTSRTLINRALDGDWPGTLAFCKIFVPSGYNADALFENLELVRTVRARGGREAVRRDIFVRRLPPTTTHYINQRIRQAYDEFARPPRLALALCILPACITAVLLKNLAPVAFLAAFSVLLASIGLVRAGGYRYFPWFAAVLAPVWITERAVCAWLAVYERVRFGGVRYAGGIVRQAASSEGELRRRWAV